MKTISLSAIISAAAVCICVMIIDRPSSEVGRPSEAVSYVAYKIPNGDEHGDEPDKESQNERQHAKRQTGLPHSFQAVDTSKLLGSPDPLPLEPKRVFPHLKFERPVELTHAGDNSGRIFVVEQRGKILVFPNQQTTASSTIFLDIEDIVLREGNEEGLLGLAFHPQFRQNGEFFVYYSTYPRVSVLSRFRVSESNSNNADRATEEQLLRIDQPYPNHNGGSLKFGPDGYLYIGLGDGGLADDPHSHGQNLSTLLGSVLRIDVDKKADGNNYSIPPDNPFINRKDTRGEIWAYGFRNIWRLAFDRKTGELWGGDVGQNRVEEINLIQRGGNYGWNIREGFQPFDPNVTHKPHDLIDPLVEYSRQDGQSVTGGLVYRGENLPGFSGAYFYGDYLSGKIWTLTPNITTDKKADSKIAPIPFNQPQFQNHLVADTKLEIAAFGEDANGEMYLCAFDGGIYQLEPREIDIHAIAQAFPKRLSETGLYNSVQKNEVTAGVIPYELNLPFWSDFSVKDRYIALPKNGSITFHESEKWEFPVGTVFIKTFWMHMNRSSMSDPKRLETRLLVSTDLGWEGYTYVYNEDQSEAFLLDGALQKPISIRTDDGMISQPYYFPSRSDCFACHTKAEGFVLGMTTRQMNHRIKFHGSEENQISMLARLKAFAQAPKKDASDLERFPEWTFGNFDRSQSSDGKSSDGKKLAMTPEGDANTLAKAWLEVNCAVCHRPEGIAPHNRDMRFSTSIDNMNLVDQDPKHGHISLPGSKLVAPGKPFESELFFRINRRGPRQMPPLATKVVDPIGHEIIKQWIEEMQKE